MKTKTLLPILALAALGLAACGNSTSSVKSSAAPAGTSSAPTVTSSIVSSETSLSDIVAFTWTVNVLGLTVDDTQNVIWLGTSLGGSAASWATYAFTEGTDAKTWSHTFTDVELGNYSYNFYVDSKDNFTWNNSYINAEGTSETSRTLSLESGDAVSTDATFAAQPDASAGQTLALTIVVTNFDTAHFQFPQFVYKKAADTSYMYIKDFVQDSTDTTKFTKSLAGVVAGDYNCYAALWQNASPWTGYSFYADTAGTAFNFTVASAALSITLSGAVATSAGVGTIVIA